jgi:hypothetical protein
MVAAYPQLAGQALASATNGSDPGVACGLFDGLAHEPWRVACSRWVSWSWTLRQVAGETRAGPQRWGSRRLAPGGTGPPRTRYWWLARHLGDVAVRMHRFHKGHPLDLVPVDGGAGVPVNFFAGLFLGLGPPPAEHQRQESAIDWVLAFDQAGNRVAECRMRFGLGNTCEPVPIPDPRRPHSCSAEWSAGQTTPPRKPVRKARAATSLAVVRCTTARQAPRCPASRAEHASTAVGHIPDGGLTAASESLLWVQAEGSLRTRPVDEL